jgi:hypothetical protein|tara:strand:+ start:242 stop:472 length:231 start_codon:yes stop_codon:yes gene_type:complete
MIKNYIGLGKTNDRIPMLIACLSGIRMSIIIGALATPGSNNSPLIYILYLGVYCEYNFGISGVAIAFFSDDYRKYG